MFAREVLDVLFKAIFTYFLSQILYYSCASVVEQTIRTQAWWWFFRSRAHYLVALVRVRAQA